MALEMNLPSNSTILQEATLRQAVQQVELAPSIAVVAISRGDELQVWRVPDTSESEDARDDIPGAALAAELVRRVHETWDHRDGTAELRFVMPKGVGGGLLLYTQSLPAPYTLILAAEPQVSVNALRTTARAIVKTVEQLQRAAPDEDDEVTLLIDQPLAEQALPESTFAIAWRPRKPVPTALHGPLTRAMERLAAANACQIAHFSLRPQVIQLLVSCPAGKNSAWVAHTFKRGSQREIQRQFNIPATLWSDGYFARESTEPLEPAEIRLFLT